MAAAADTSNTPPTAPAPLGYVRAYVDALRPYRPYWGIDLALTALFIVVAVLLSLGNIDMATSTFFYRGGGRELGWPIGSQEPWQTLQALPPFIVVPAIVISLLYVILGYTRFVPRRYRFHFLFLFLALWIGPGIIVESILKINYGRPRPCVLSDFGGLRAFHSAFTAGIPGQGRSFVSGHTASTYYLTTLYFLFRRKDALAFALLAGSILLGTLVGVGRIASGCHFVSDVAWALVVVFLSNLVIYYFILNIPALEDGVHTRATAFQRHRAFIPALFGLLGLVHYAIYVVSP